MDDMVTVPGYLSYFRGRRVFITGHTGFKGSWLCEILLSAGAEVSGYALPPQGEPNLFDLLGLRSRMNSCFGDIRDFEKLNQFYGKINPEFIFHLAAQPIVRESYRNPRDTYETNVMGTVHLMECARESGSVKGIVNVTTDKVYQEAYDIPHIELDTLDGYDPYSNSKSCSELVTGCYKRSFLEQKEVSVSTARAGNVIGGGDFAVDRIIPDCIRSALAGKPIVVRSPDSIRPYQHVLEPLFGYLRLMEAQCENPNLAGCYNIGPRPEDSLTTRQLVEIFCKYWGNAEWESLHHTGPHESKVLQLDIHKIEKELGWYPVWTAEKAVQMTVEWVKAWQEGNAENCVRAQIREYAQTSQYGKTGEGELICT